MSETGFKGRAFVTIGGQKPLQIEPRRSVHMNTEVLQTALAAPAGSFSVLSLFWQSHIVVKLVMIGLIIASIWCWAIIFDKWMLFARLRRKSFLPRWRWR